MTSAPILIHYGYHPGTTGSHFAAAGLATGLGYPRASEASNHLSSSAIRDCGAYFWIESGTCAYPFDIWNYLVPTAGYLIDSHLHSTLSLLQAALFDVVFVAQRKFLPAVRRVNPNSFWLPLAAPSWFVSHRTTARRYEIGFVGSLSQSASRRALLLSLQEKFSTNEFSRIYSVEEMADLYSSSHCVVNPPVADDLNMRFFEAMACGAALITPPLDNGMNELATPGEHLLALPLDDPDTVSDAITALLRTGGARALGESARNLIRDGHTYEHRLTEVGGRLRSVSQTAPIRGFSKAERGRHMLALGESVRNLHLVTMAARYLGVDSRVPRAVAHAGVSTVRRYLLS